MKRGTMWTTGVSWLEMSEQEIVNMEHEMNKTEREKPMVLLRPSEVAARLRISKAFVYELCHTRGFPSLYIGKRVFIVEEKLDEWLEKQMNT